MGMTCPQCLTHQAIVQNLTTHQGKTNQFARDVIAYRLACGHDVGGEEFKEFQKYVHESEAKLQEEMLKAKKEHNARLNKAFAMVRSVKGGGK